MYFVSFSPYNRLVDSGVITLVSAAEEFKVKACLLWVVCQGQSLSPPSIYRDLNVLLHSSGSIFPTIHSNGSESNTEIGDWG